MKNRLKKLVKVENKLELKDNLKQGLKGVSIALPIVGLLAVGYFGLKTSKDPDYKDFLGGD